MDAASLGLFFTSVALCHEKVHLSWCVCYPELSWSSAGNVVQQSKPDEWMNGGGRGGRGGGGRMEAVLYQPQAFIRASLANVLLLDPSRVIACVLRQHVILHILLCPFRKWINEKTCVLFTVRVCLEGGALRNIRLCL